MLWSIFITYIITHHGLGGFSGLINGLIAAAIGALSMLMSEPTVKSYVKRTCMFVLSIATFTCTFKVNLQLYTLRSYASIAKILWPLCHSSTNLFGLLFFAYVDVCVCRE